MAPVVGLACLGSMVCLGMLRRALHCFDHCFNMPSGILRPVQTQGPSEYQGSAGNQAAKLSKKASCQPRTVPTGERRSGRAQNSACIAGVQAELDTQVIFYTKALLVKNGQLGHLATEEAGEDGLKE